MPVKKYEEKRVTNFIHFDGLSLEELLEEIQDTIFKYGADARVEMAYEYDYYPGGDRYTEINLIYKRWFSEEELKKRAAVQRKRQAAGKKAAAAKREKQEEKERAQYEKLKKKYS
jgi:hypothetical protein